MRILSGIQPSGQMHIGNYFGAIIQHVELQDQGDALYFVADLHALNTIKDGDQLRALTFDLVATYLAMGLDPSRCTLFRQSDVPQITELTWILATVTGMGLLERGTSYKDKIARGQQASAGLFFYPVLMAADILAYDSDVVPVGQDQTQHIEFARDMAGYLNTTYGQELLKLPLARLGTAPLVPGTDGQKMSKSYGNTLPLFDSGKSLRKKVMGITTDSTPMEDPKDPTTCTVFQLYSLVATPEEKAEMAARYRAGGYGYGHAKQALYEKLEEYFADGRARRAALDARPDDVHDLLEAGAVRARELAGATLDRVRQAVGL